MKRKRKNANVDYQTKISIQASFSRKKTLISQTIASEFNKN